MDGSTDDQTRKQRELRRKKILDNAKSRMEKLKRLQQSSSSTQQGIDEDKEAPDKVISEHVPDHHVDDPPDEIIERAPSSPKFINDSNLLQTNQANVKPSFLYRVVATIRSDRAFKTRTITGLLFSLILTILTVIFEQSFSYVTSMLLMELTLLVAITLVAQSDTTATTLKGHWILQLKGLLAFLHPVLPDVFEVTYLCLYVAMIVLRDLIIMIFGVVVFMSIGIFILQT